MQFNVVVFLSYLTAPGTIVNRVFYFEKGAVVKHGNYYGTC